MQYIPHINAISPSYMYHEFRFYIQKASSATTIASPRRDRLRRGSVLLGCAIGPSDHQVYRCPRVHNKSISSRHMSRRQAQQSTDQKSHRLAVALLQELVLVPSACRHGDGCRQNDRDDSYIRATWICQHYYVMAWSRRDLCFEGVLPFGTSAEALILSFPARRPSTDLAAGRPSIVRVARPPTCLVDHDTSFGRPSMSSPLPLACLPLCLFDQGK